MEKAKEKKVYITESELKELYYKKDNSILLSERISNVKFVQEVLDLNFLIRSKVAIWRQQIPDSNGYHLYWSQIKELNERVRKIIDENP